eukprot:m.24565 g.24565  ORF g.24565 m.24565 type:complete len:694 (+) comp9705_c0_seq1:100-2181(+)
MMPRYMPTLQPHAQCCLLLPRSWKALRVASPFIWQVKTLSDNMLLRSLASTVERQRWPCLIAVARRSLYNEEYIALPQRATPPCRRWKATTAHHLQTAMRTHACGTISVDSVGNHVKLAGFLASKRQIGDSLVFAVLRDHYGSVQLKITDPDLMKQLLALPLESTLQVKGSVEQRPGDTVNPNMATGEVEVAVQAVSALGRATRHPFRVGIDTKEQAKEDLRLTHRPLDLRRSALQHAITLRSKVSSVSRAFLETNGFLDIETPTLFKRTPGGAAEFLVPTQKRGQFYALVQSPQQYKQMLMVGGFDRYYQFARCYRDEGGRLDRQPEFTQVDLEMAFIQQEDILALTEALVKEMWKAGCDIELEPPFQRMPFQVAMKKYGSDKPDLRYGMELTDASEHLITCDAPVWKDILSGGGRIVGFKAENASDYFVRRRMDQLKEFAKGINGPALVSVRVLENGSIQSPVAKSLSDTETVAMLTAFEANPGDVLFLAGGSSNTLLPFLGKMRTRVASMLSEGGLLSLDPRDFRFLWVVDFPLFEQHELHPGRLQACHHPFTAPHPEDIDLLRTNPTQARAQHFDLVVNGIELGGGSVRIHDPEMQLYVLQDILKEDPAVFEQLLGALQYGAPPHGGIALGFDRAMLCMLASTGAQSLRDVIAFPKSFAGKELMSGSPCEVPEEDLRTYYLRVLEEDRT